MTNVKSSSEIMTMIEDLNMFIALESNINRAPQYDNILKTSMERSQKYRRTEKHGSPELPEFISGAEFISIAYDNKSKK